MTGKLYLLSALLLAGCATSGKQPSAGGQPAGGVSGAGECGEASYYADSLSGNATASGEPYDPKRLTAAHKTLPFGTTIRVVRKDTGDEVEVRVNDRGPYAAGRIVDVSRAAAAELGLLTAGVADVCIYVQ